MTPKQKFTVLMIRTTSILNTSPSEVWYVHFAACFYIDIYCIMGCYFTLCHNTYGYSLLFYKVYMKRENAGSWNSGLEKEQILETYSAQLQKSWNFTEDVFKIYKKYSAEEIHQGGHTLPTRVGARPTPLGTPPGSWTTWQPSRAHLLVYEVFYPGKNHKQAFGTKHHRHEAEPI